MSESPPTPLRLPTLAFVLAVLGCAAAALAEPLPAPEPPELPDGIAAELASLQAQIDELRAAAAKPETKKNTDFVPNKLSPHGKPTMELGGKMQADTVYFSQDQESIAAVGDLQDGTQFRRLRLVARGKTWKQLQYALGVDFALADQPAFLDNYLEVNDIPWLQNIRAGHYFEPSASNG